MAIPSCFKPVTLGLPNPGCDDRYRGVGKLSYFAPGTRTRTRSGFGAVPGNQGKA